MTARHGVKHQQTTVASSVQESETEIAKQKKKIMKNYSLDVEDRAEQNRNEINIHFYI